MSFYNHSDFKRNNDLGSSSLALSEFSVVFFCPVFPPLLQIVHVLLVWLNGLYQMPSSLGLYHWGKKMAEQRVCQLQAFWYFICMCIVEGYTRSLCSCGLVILAARTFGSNSYWYLWLPRGEADVLISIHDSFILSELLEHTNVKHDSNYRLIDDLHSTVPHHGFSTASRSHCGEQRL